jgi:hypothetical protein
MRLRQTPRGLMSVNVQNRPLVARRYRRYIVDGSAAVQGPLGESRGALLNVGQGGILVRTDVPQAQGMDLTIQFHLYSYPETFASRGQIVGIKDSMLAIKFLEEPQGLRLLLAWLQLQNCTWSGVV